MSDEMRERLQRHDPVPPDAAIHPDRLARSAEILESVMSTTPIPSLDDESTTTVPAGSASTGRRRRWTPLAALGAGVATLAVAGVLATGGGSPAATSVTYDLEPFDPMAMCLQVSEIQPDPATAAFGGTVTDIQPGTVTLDVDTWYQNGDADQVVLDTTDLPSVALDGVEFTVGTRYLVSVVDGTVAICGMSGPATPELEALFTTWYGA